VIPEMRVTPSAHMPPLVTGGGCPFRQDVPQYAAAPNLTASIGAPHPSSRGTLLKGHSHVDHDSASVLMPAHAGCEASGEDLSGSCGADILSSQVATCEPTAMSAAAAASTALATLGAPLPTALPLSVAGLTAQQIAAFQSAYLRALAEQQQTTAIASPMKTVLLPSRGMGEVQQVQQLQLCKLQMAPSTSALDAPPPPPPPPLPPPPPPLHDADRPTMRVCDLVAEHELLPTPQVPPAAAASPPAASMACGTAHVNQSATASCSRSISATTTATNSAAPSITVEPKVAVAHNSCGAGTDSSCVVGADISCDRSPALYMGVGSTCSGSGGDVAARSKSFAAVVAPASEPSSAPLVSDTAALASTAVETSATSAFTSISDEVRCCEVSASPVVEATPAGLDPGACAAVTVPEASGTTCDGIAPSAISEEERLGAAVIATSCAHGPLVTHPECSMSASSLAAVFPTSNASWLYVVMAGEFGTPWPVGVTRTGVCCGRLHFKARMQQWVLLATPPAEWRNVHVEVVIALMLRTWGELRPAPTDARWICFPYLSELPRSVMDLPARYALGDIDLSAAAAALPAEAASLSRVAPIAEATVQRDVKAIGACPPPGRSQQRASRRKRAAPAPAPSARSPTSGAFVGLSAGHSFAPLPAPLPSHLHASLPTPLSVGPLPPSPLATSASWPSPRSDYHSPTATQAAAPALSLPLSAACGCCNSRLDGMGNSAPGSGSRAFLDGEAMGGSTMGPPEARHPHGHAHHGHNTMSATSTMGHSHSHGTLSHAPHSHQPHSHISSDLHVSKRHRTDPAPQLAAAQPPPATLGGPFGRPPSDAVTASATGPMGTSAPPPSTHAGSNHSTGGNSASSGSGMRNASSVSDLLQSFGLGRLAQGSPQMGGLPPSSSMLQLLAALDSPTGRLTDSLTATSGEGDSQSTGGTSGGRMPASLSSGSLTHIPTSSVSNLRSLLRNVSSNANLSELADSGSLEQQLHTFFRSASLQASLNQSTSHLPHGHSAPAMPPPASQHCSPPSHRSPPLAAARCQWGCDASDMLLPSERLLRESPSVSSLVELVRSSSATSLVELMHSYSSTNLASLVKDDGQTEA